MTELASQRRLPQEQIKAEAQDARLAKDGAKSLADAIKAG